MIAEVAEKQAWVHLATQGMPCPQRTMGRELRVSGGDHSRVSGNKTACQFNLALPPDVLLCNDVGAHQDCSPSVAVFLDLLPSSVPTATRVRTRQAIDDTDCIHARLCRTRVLCSISRCFQKYAEAHEHSQQPGEWEHGLTLGRPCPKGRPPTLHSRTCESGTRPGLRSCGAVQCW